MKRLLSSIGIGAATVDTVLSQAAVRPGEQVELAVDLAGGDVAQRIDGLYFTLKAESGGDEWVVDRYSFDGSFVIEPGEERTEPVSIFVPSWTPITRGGPRVWLETGLEIDWAVDPTDTDDVVVEPGPYVAALFEAAADLGFEFASSTMEETPWLDDRPFAQRLVFTPGERFERQVEALVLTTIPRDDDLRLYIQVDTRDQVADAVGQDFNEQELSVTVTYANPEMIARRITSTIDEFT
ncbi:sporulation protein [Salinigranum halophilum]|uniref:sporulation protein n=1 Tax=Salinigranum halophilum TaxID=2565931 RepID=UPI0010A885F8|nr:sporulation protein [Salinigranum halophilum]